jgi:hypothetical protein
MVRWRHVQGRQRSEGANHDGTEHSELVVPEVSAIKCELLGCNGYVGCRARMGQGLESLQSFQEKSGRENAVGQSCKEIRSEAPYRKTEFGTGSNNTRARMRV